MAELLTFLAPVASTISTLSKFAILCASFAAVESEVNAYALLLRHHQNTLNSIVTQLPKKQHLLDEGFRAYIENALADSVVSMSMIDSLLGEMVKKVEKKGRVSWRQRFGWVFADTEAAQALEKFMAGVHVTMVGIDTRLGATQEPPPKQIERVVVERIIERVIEKTKEKTKCKHDKAKDKERELQKRHTEPAKSTTSTKNSKRKGSTSSVATFPPPKAQERKLGHGEMLAVWFAGGNPAAEKGHRRSSDDVRSGYEKRRGRPHEISVAAAVKTAERDRSSDHSKKFSSSPPTKSWSIPTAAPLGPDSKPKVRRPSQDSIKSAHKLEKRNHNPPTPSPPKATPITRIVEMAPKWGNASSKAILVTETALPTVAPPPPAPTPPLPRNKKKK